MTTARKQADLFMRLLDYVTNPDCVCEECIHRRKVLLVLGAVGVSEVSAEPEHEETK